MVNEVISYLRKTSVEPEKINSYLEALGTTKISQKVKAITLSARPMVKLGELLEVLESSGIWGEEKPGNMQEILESAEIRIKYEGYIERERIIAEKIKRLEKLKIPEDLNYAELLSISTEGRQKLERIRPATIGQAQRISGVSPSDISILLLYLGR